MKRLNTMYSFLNFLQKTKKQKSLKITLAFGLAFILNSTGLNAQTYAERALYRDAFTAAQITNVEVVNKYGSIHINHWEKDSIVITTDVYLSSTSRSKLSKLKQDVRVKYAKHNNGILAQTLFGANQTSLLEELQYLARNFTQTNEKRIEINYEVFLPKHIALDIRNQYGDIFMGDFTENLKIDQSNGSFKAGKLNGVSSLKFRFVDAMVHEIKEGVLDFSYSNLNLNKAVNLNCESKSSEIYADEVGILKLKSSRDKLSIGKLDYAYGSASYSNLKILQLNKELDGYFTYGQVSIDKVDEQTKLIDIDSERTDIKLFIPKNISYNYDILYYEDADLLLPEKEIKVIDSMDMEQMKSTKGKVGNTPTLDIRIRALRRCLIQLLHVSEN